MTAEERARMNELCALIQQERDPKRFEEYVRQLNELLDDKRVRITPSQP
jgi:hypothetical protein